MLLHLHSQWCSLLFVKFDKKRVILRRPISSLIMLFYREYSLIISGKLIKNWLVVLNWGHPNETWGDVTKLLTQPFS